MGIQDTKFYMVWRNMNERCSRKNHRNYKNYGGRGITVSETWKKYANFEKDMYMSYVEHGYDNGYSENDIEDFFNARNHTSTLERIDNSKGYYKENCRWATIKEQNNNRRKNPKDVLFTINNETKNLLQWSKVLGIKYNTLVFRIHTMKWSIEKAINTPIKGHKK